MSNLFLSLPSFLVISTLHPNVNISFRNPEQGHRILKITFLNQTIEAFFAELVGFLRFCSGSSSHSNFL